MTTPAPETIEREQGKPITPEAFAKDMGWGAKRVRQLAKKLGACCILGNRMVLLPRHLEIITKATEPCPSSSSNDTSGTAALFGTTGEMLPATTYAERLAQRTRKTRRELHPRSSTNASTVISMDRKTR